MDDFDFQNAPSAPAYALESSSGESDWGSEDEQIARARPRKVKQPAKEAVVDVQGHVQDGTDVLFLVGEAGERMAKGIKTGQADASSSTVVLVDGEQMATIVALAGQPTLVFLSQELPLVSLYPLASTLVQQLKPKTSIAISSYHLPTYVSSAASARSESPPVLYLRSQSTPALDSLSSSGSLTPYEPPNLLHGLASLLLTLSALSGVPSTLILLPTVTQPSPLNGPFTQSSSSTDNAFYDAGPTSLSDPGAVYQDIKRGKLSRIAAELGWDKFWSANESGGSGFGWLEKSRKLRRKELAGSMYM